MAKQKELFYRILEIANNKDDVRAEVSDLISVAQNKLKTDKEKGLEYCKLIKLFLNNKIKISKALSKQLLLDRYFDVLVLETPYSLDSYFQALEWGREPKDKFWMPRRKQLLPIVHKLEDLLINDKIDELFLSQPARTGKSTLSMFTLSWVMGINSELANLYCSNSGTVINAFYKGVLEIITDNYTYQWWKIFKEVKFDKNSFTNAKDTYLDVGRIKRYHSFTGRSIDGDGLNGACDCNGLLIGDDLCSGYEEALNKTRLNMLWGKVDNNLLTRAKMGCKILWIGTRWSLHDPIGRRLRMLQNDPAFSKRRFEVVNIPALNENDESNFDYKYGVGFDTNYFKERRASFIANNDEPSFLAQYMGQPIERSGLLFPQEEMRYYNGVLPQGIPDRVFAFVDIAWGGGDFTSMPIAYQFGKALYIHDWVFSEEDKFITRPLVIQKTIEHKLSSLRFEKNNGGEEYREYCERELVKKGYKCMITTRMATRSKEVRIYENAPEIREMWFLEPSKRSSMYARAMTNLTSYTGLDKKQHDDAPDSLSGLVDMYNEIEKRVEVSIFKRPF